MGLIKNSSLPKETLEQIKTIYENAILFKEALPYISAQRIDFDINGVFYHNTTAYNTWDRYMTDIHSSWDDPDTEPNIYPDYNPDKNGKYPVLFDGKKIYRPIYDDEGNLITTENDYITSDNYVYPDSYMEWDNL